MRIVLGSNIYIPTGATVTYHVDANVIYTEVVENGESCYPRKHSIRKKSDGISLDGAKIKVQLLPYCQKR